MDYEEKYNAVLKRAKIWQEHLNEIGDKDYADELNYIFPELKESEDDRMKKAIMHVLYENYTDAAVIEGVEIAKIIAWLEKQGDTGEIINRDEFTQDILKGAAINLITWIDYNAAEGNMCLSNTECKDIGDALVNGDWDKIYAYIKKKLEKQGEQNSVEWSEEDEQSKNWILEYLYDGLRRPDELFKDEFKAAISWLESRGEQKSTDNKKLDLLKFIRKETGCGLAEANDALLKLIKVLKEHPFTIMDKPHKLKIELEDQK